MSRTIRGSVARLLIAALLFMQFAVAAYAAYAGLASAQESPSAAAPLSFAEALRREPPSCPQLNAQRLAVGAADASVLLAHRRTAKRLG